MEFLQLPHQAENFPNIGELLSVMTIYDKNKESLNFIQCNLLHRFSETPDMSKITAQIIQPGIWYKSILILT